MPERNGAEKSLADLLEESTERCRNMDAPLATRLAALANDVRTLNAEFATVVDHMVTRLKAVGAGEEAPRPGDPMPEFVLPDQNGRLVSLAGLLEQGPVVVAFHRGHWCPYCRISASALASIDGEVRAGGAALVAITPEVEKFTAELAGDAKANFPILSDMDNGYALMLNLAFYVGDEKRRYMTAAGWDVSPFQGNESWTLPIPATFVIGKNGRVTARFIDPDYRKRMEIDDILDAVRSAQSS
ncbi:MAG TPA: peroxiredoxin-like family protein [Hyphomicrobiaceae bacterium]|nr:peroxiredoxin-like family protein [Hyphomicrobiaceae bacterium]